MSHPNNKLELALIEQLKSNEAIEEFSSIPLDINDLLFICREFNQLGLHIQTQIENILEIGVQEAIQGGIVKEQSLPLIKQFLKQITLNPYFGEAKCQANDVINLISEYEYNKNKLKLN